MKDSYRGTPLEREPTHISYVENEGQEGVTLIELIVVLVILGIIIAVTTQKLTEVIDRARISATKCDVTSMRMALSLYKADYGSYKIGTGLYVGVDGYKRFKSNLKDYSILPDTTNFYPAEFKYTGDTLSFTLELRARDSRRTTILCTPTQLSTVTQP